MLARQLKARACPTEIVHLDISKASQTIARARATALQLTDLRFVHGSLFDIATVAPGPYDYIDCCGVLHHFARSASRTAHTRDGSGAHRRHRRDGLRRARPHRRLSRRRDSEVSGARRRCGARSRRARRNRPASDRRSAENQLAGAQPVRPRPHRRRRCRHIRPAAARAGSAVSHRRTRPAHRRRRAAQDRADRAGILSAGRSRRRLRVGVRDQRA